MGNFLFKGVVRTLARLVRAFLYLILAMSSSRLKIWGPKKVLHNACLTVDNVDNVDNVVSIDNVASVMRQS